MRRKRICIYGGTELQGMSPRFISALAYAILREMQPVVIVTGGFVRKKGRRGRATSTSTDAAALAGARRFADEVGVAVKDCYEAYIPDPRMENRPDPAVRMGRGDGIAVRQATGRTPLGRRLAMVEGVDIVVTIAGRKHTEVVVEQALDRRVPVLPLPNANGDSKELLRWYRTRIGESFGRRDLTRCLRTVTNALRHRREAQAAAAVVDLLKTVKTGTCLVLLPYEASLEPTYRRRIKPAIERHMFVDRLDHSPQSKQISESFAASVRSASAVIVDVTDLNPNVMYEVGYAHGLGLTPLLFTRKAARVARLPVYLRNLNVRAVTAKQSLSALIDEHLRFVKNLESP